ncbi:MAG: MurR/RpiR family transcriptional regulator [Candidatus Accumulibacter sp.]|jgi:DNA-binding MurR/RpiR family transcriptional regulator|nr:MurR/RpiR family transcriptional regulator [Accumulibacter sp.]
MVRSSSVEDLVRRIAGEYDALSRQLKAIARYVTENQQRMIVVRIRDIVDTCGVQASAVVRFAQYFGFSGFSEMQAVFRDAYANSTVTAASYQQRIRAMISKNPAKMKSFELARSFLEACQSGIGAIGENLDAHAFDKAVALLQNAKHIYIMGVRRMFPVASYLGYVLPRTRKRVVLIDAMGSMYREQIESLAKGDVLIAISMSPYGEETHFCTEIAVERQASVLAITDSSLSPISRLAAVTLLVHEAEVYNFRALACTMSLVQSLFIALAYRLELDLNRKSHRGQANVPHSGLAAGK